MRSRPKSLLFSSIQLRGITLKNRVVISPMAQYCGNKGNSTDWHFAHLAGFATGGAGLIFTESTKVEPRGVGSYGDLSLWSEEHVASFRRITGFLKQMGASPGIQLNHSGRKARSQRPWEGFGPIQAPESELWPVIAPSSLKHEEGWALPREMTLDDIHEVIDSWVRAAKLAVKAGFEVMEIHGAHGYLVHQFLSPVANRRSDAYGGSLTRRMRFALELTEAMRAVWPSELPLFFRVSATDDMGWTLDDTMALAKELTALGVDIIDCSSGGMTNRSPTASQTNRGLGYQVPYAERIKKELAIRTMAVGLIIKPKQAEAILTSGAADLIAIGREALYDPYWALHAAQELDIDPDFSLWPKQYGWWLDRRNKAGAMAQIDPVAEKRHAVAASNTVHI
jgi:2,4-dienoyl-CoA reductase-like NADH-dependent reductase (Old Yellow Enzyme family)